MDDLVKEDIERTRRYLLGSTLAEDTKDGLQNLLTSAARGANGTPDKLQAIADAMLALAIHEVKQAVRLPALVQSAVDAHSVKCPLNSPGGKFGLIYRMRWPLAAVACAACVSPNFPLIAALIKEVWR